MKYKSCYKRNNCQSYIKDKVSSKYLSNESFDLIYANNSLEHWYEAIQDIDQSLELYRKDISRCYSLLKPGGFLLVNAPMHLHGNPIFVHAKVDIIEKFFDWNDWESVVFEHWRQQHDDLMPYAPTGRKKAWLDRFGYELRNIWLGNLVAKKQK
jgi:SAM-dependent methyltransferase